MPVPETNGEEWDRLEPASALDALVELVLHGEYNGLYSAKRSRDGMELRSAALGVFQVCTSMIKLPVINNIGPRGRTSCRKEISKKPSFKPWPRLKVINMCFCL